MSDRIPIKTKTLIIILLDESGSMGSKFTDVTGGYNEFMRQQKVIGNDEGRVALVKFNTVACVTHEPMSLDLVPDLCEKNYTPGGGTALFDAIAEGIRLGDKYKENDERVLCLIMTDGEENSSRETSLQQVKDLITAHEGHGDWTFAYIGEAPDRWSTRCGMSLNNVRQYRSRRPQRTFKLASVATASFRASIERQSFNFFSAEKAADLADSGDNDD